MKQKSKPNPPPQNLDSPPLAGGGRGRGSARESGHAVQEEGAVSPSPLAGEGWGEGAASEPRVVSEGPITPYLAKPQQPRRSREPDHASGGNPVLYRLAPLGDLIRPRREKAQPAACPDLPYIGMEHVESHTMRLLGTVPAATMKSTANRFYAGDVLYGRLRPYLNKVYRADFDGLCSAEFIVLPNTEGVDPDFLRYRLNSRDFVSFTTHLNAGDRPRVDFDQISPFEIEVPEANEQRRIVADLETQLTRLDASVTALKRVQANLKRYRASVLKAAYEGYASVKLGTVLTFRNGVNFRANQRGESGVKVVDVKNMYGLSIMLDTKDIYTVALDGFDRFLLEANDVLFVRSSVKLEGVGWPVLVGELAEPVTFCGFLIRGRPVSKQIDPRFLVYALRTPRIRGAIVNLGSEVTITNISQDDLAALDIPLPIKDEQHRIVAEVEHRLSVIEELEATVAANLKRAERLRQSVLGRAFS